MYNHVLTDKGLEIFDNDWKEVEPLLAKQETPYQE